MCGLTGFIDLDRATGAETLTAIARRMADTMIARGPDGSGVWVDAEAGIALAHRRLAILDLSEAGHQPMISSCGRFVVSYNGEIYNAPALKSELERAGRNFRGHSDTEVIIEGAAVWGVRGMLERIRGMFALALWDRSRQDLVLARDRLGIKPLYWGIAGRVVLFGSQLGALRAHHGWQPRLNRDAVTSFLRHNYVPAPQSIYQGISKLEPGRMVTLSRGGTVRTERFWSLDDAVTAGRNNPLLCSDAEAIDQLEELLSDSVAGHMLSDVPVGAFLSGGIDSSAVVALMQAGSTRPVRTFTIGFDEPGYNEADHAKAVARHLGTDHCELVLSADAGLDVIPSLPDFYDEPFADSSQIPTYMVSKLTREHVTVALSGDGGDELFAGYNRHLQAAKWGHRLGRVPMSARRLSAWGLTRLSQQTWDRLFARLPGQWPPQPGDKLHKLAGVLTEDADSLYRRLVSHWTDPAALVRGGTEPKDGLLWDPALAAALPAQLDRMQYLDTLTYLPDDILCKVDRASMAVSLESRVPLLDHRVVEFSWRLPAHLRVRHGHGKWLLRQVLYRHVPHGLIDRPKMGFAIPLDTWLRGKLRPWAEALLDEKRLAAQGLLDPAPIRACWAEHLSGKRNWQYLLWDVLMLQAWLDRHGTGLTME
ncbi:asparagine synthase (glutamine-hydrolyzing) [Magnetospirillum fulvum]|uniref:asparagine synthase (glutamine-hydrolyzing) n=1 Tax=Magnetospirillum fulvum MGU-K5 TaxID=1316936 RepID=S9S786_MAGFU|nr:asparagine synthase (glutamine-hydrolyzing) [Magnetospirillum fulvum]EPY01737.1 asparagine synthase [Magnetospirillum fulvum MGU-K5]